MRCRSSRPAGYIVTLDGVSIAPATCRDIYAPDRYNPSGPPVVDSSVYAPTTAAQINTTFSLDQWRADRGGLPGVCQMNPVGLGFDVGRVHEGSGCSGDVRAPHGMGEARYDLVVNFEFNQSGSPAWWPFRIGYAHIEYPPTFTFGYIGPTSTVVFFEGVVPAGAVCARGFTIYNQHTSPSLRGSVDSPVDFTGWYWIKGYGGTATFTPYW